MVPERHSALGHSEKELLEWRYGAFCHRNTPGYNATNWLSTQSNHSKMGPCENKGTQNGSFQI
jgi:hypothetical protein